MYFHDNKKNTNIDNEFKENKNILSSVLEFIKKYKIIIIIITAILLVVIMTLIFTSNSKSQGGIGSIIKVENYLTLLGEEEIILYQGSDYIEPGYTAHNSKNEDLTSKVKIETNLDINTIGEYEITYKIENTNKTRKIKIIPKIEIENYTFIYLNTIKNDVNVYLKLGEEYKEPGYKVYNNNGLNLNDSVKISSNVDSSKKGIYKIIYSVIDNNNATISVTRDVIVMDIEINLSLNNNDYTNDSVGLNINVKDDYFDYIILPNGEKITKNNYTYTTTENGTYTFTAYNKKGMSKTNSIEVKNIDKTPPTGSCELDVTENGSSIKITASDEIGIKKYIYKDNTYTNNTINLSTVETTATVTIYDKANNTKDVTCKITPGASIQKISNDGVIVTINTTTIATEITGYYFSYNKKRPDKNGGYLKTNKKTIDVVRLPGTTYVWVEDKNGKISPAKTLTLTNSVLFSTNNNNFEILKGTKLSTYLSNKGWSIDELNKLIARSSRAAGLYTKTSAATSAVALQTVLAQKYKIKIPYWWGGKSWNFGASTEWGKSSYKYANGTAYRYYGLDCSGYTTWTYINAGYNVPYNTYPKHWGNYKSISYSKENGEIGDFLVSSQHIKLIIGKTQNAFITAEAKGNAYGMVISTQSFSAPNGFKILKGEQLMNAHSKYPSSSYPSGF